VGLSLEEHEKFHDNDKNIAEYLNTQLLLKLKPLFQD